MTGMCKSGAAICGTSRLDGQVGNHIKARNIARTDVITTRDTDFGAVRIDRTIARDQNILGAVKADSKPLETGIAAPDSAGQIGETELVDVVNRSLEIDRVTVRARIKGCCESQVPIRRSCFEDMSIGSSLDREKTILRHRIEVPCHRCQKAGAYRQC